MSEIVDARPVGAADIDDAPTGLVPSEPGMPARDRGALDDDVVPMIAANRENVLLERDHDLAAVLLEDDLGRHKPPSRSTVVTSPSGPGPQTIIPKAVLSGLSASGLATTTVPV